MKQESVAPKTQESGALNENVVIDEMADKMPDDFKQDFFKHKQMMKDALADKNELLERVKAFEEKEAERVGNHQKIIDTLKEENKALKDSITTSQKESRYNSFKKQIESKANDLGFTKPERILNFLSDDDKAMLVMDESNKIDEFGMDKAFESVKKEWGELFKPKNVRIADGAPTTNLNEKPQKSVKEMTSAERIALALKISRDKK